MGFWGGVHCVYLRVESIRFDVGLFDAGWAIHGVYVDARVRLRTRVA